ncbi:peptide deformylase [Compostimonas suwonensis]|uniref:Peptide deformylase n=1 Tax=Compostimonas suwonensis TaxID=1048394 RepID=A0A2M9BZ09_9MICO|nr:peptide deformylase [Compostimonas suwonensis]PJJ63318.1 peptide deformylase [Compostimonas suwonensis]
MAVLPIRISGDPVLHAPARDVTEFDDSLRTLVRDMYETMDLAPGVGLAAPQVGVPLRIFVFSYEIDALETVRGVAINPTLWLSPIDPGEPDEESESEGCLSFPGERFPLRRAHSAILQAVDLEQRPFEIRADGWLARIFQHEYDHLDGLLYVDRLEHVYGRRADKVERKRGWGVPGLSWTPGDEQLDG